MHTRLRLDIFAICILVLAGGGLVFAQEILPATDASPDPGTAELANTIDATVEAPAVLAPENSEPVKSELSTVAEAPITEAPAASLGARTVQNISWQLLATIRQQKVALTLNGYPILAPNESAQVSSAQMIGKWLVPGRNVLTIHYLENLSPPPAKKENSKPATEERSTFVDEQGEVQEIIFEMIEESEAEIPKPELTISIAGMSSQDPESTLQPFHYVLGGKVRYPSSRQLDFNVALVSYPRLFTEGEKIRVNDATRKEAWKVVEAYAECLRTANVEKLLDLSAFVIRDSAEAEGIDVETYRATLKAQMEKFLLKEAMEITLPKPGDLVWTSVLNSRAIHTSFALGKDGMSLSFTLGRVDGKLQLVR